MIRGTLRRAGAEALGTGLLVGALVLFAAIASRLLGTGAWAVLASTCAAAVGLVGILVNLRPLSGAHMNPAITVGAAIQGGVPWTEVPWNAAAQLLGAVGIGVPLMRAVGPPLLAQHAGSAVSLEALAAFGFHTVYAGTAGRAELGPTIAPACYLAAVYWFTGSGSLGNPALALAWAMGSGVSTGLIGTIAAQVGGATASGAFWRWLRGGPSRRRPGPERSGRAW